MKEGEKGRFDLLSNNFKCDLTCIQRDMEPRKLNNSVLYLDACSSCTMTKETSSQVLKVFPYPATVTGIQFAVGTVVVLLMWGLNLYKKPKISGAQVLSHSWPKSMFLIYWWL